MSVPRIPTGTLRSLDRVPAGAHATLLLRHAPRHPLPPDEAGDEVTLTSDGVKLAERFGATLAHRRPGRLRSSAVRRCVDTAEAMARGAGWSLRPTPDPRLGAPGPFVIDGRDAWSMFVAHGTVGVVERQLASSVPLPGMRPTADGVLLLVEAITEGPEHPGGVDLLVTHDAILAVAVGHLFGFTMNDGSWPDFLEALIGWREDGRLVIAWRGDVRHVSR